MTFVALAREWKSRTDGWTNANGFLLVAVVLVVVVVVVDADAVD